MQRAIRLLLWSAALISGLGVGVGGQEKATAPQSATMTMPPGTHTAGAAPIALPEVALQAESAAISLRDIDADLSSDHTIGTIGGELPAFTREIRSRLDESSKILTASPSIDTLTNLEAGWQQVSENLSAWTRELTRSATRLDEASSRVAALDSRWRQTERLAPRSDMTPEEARHIDATLAAIKTTRERVEKRRDQILALQDRVVEQNVRVIEMRHSLARARSEIFSRLLVADSPPIWTAASHARSGLHLVTESQASFSSQRTALFAYIERRTIRFVMHALFIVLLFFGLYEVRQRALPLAAKEPGLLRAALVFETPGLTAVVLSILISGWIYPQAPRLLLALLGAAVLIPTILILRRLIDRNFYSILNMLVTCYFIDQLREVTAATPLLSRLLFLAEFLGVITFLTWLSRPARSATATTEEQRHLWGAIRTGARIALALASVAFAAGALGYVNLANYLGNAMLKSLYSAAVLYVAIRILNGLIMFALRLRPLILLDMVRRHHVSLQRRAHFLLQLGAFVLWTLFVLRVLELRDFFATKTHEALNASLAIDSFRLSLGHVLAFGITVWVAFLLSRFTRFLLDEDIYPRVHLAHGIPYAISTLLHYVILLVGFYAAVAALGFDMTRFTILAGAFGVGFGFGLQNIVNNFVSGLILLFERPIKVGDVIQLDDATGTVERIGIRASIIRATNGSEVIVPNGKLISDRVTNWTLSNRLRNIQVPFDVASGTDPHRVMDLLQGVAAEHPLITAHPPPEVLFVKFNPGALNFELHAWTDHFEEWERTRSDLAVAIHKALADAGITMP